METTTLGFESLDELTEFANDPQVVRFGSHVGLEKRSVWATWLGDVDTNRDMVLGAWDAGQLRAVVRLRMTVRRRRVHVGTVEVLAHWEENDDALELALSTLIDTADRWLQVSRLEIVAPAGHRRIAGLYASLGFVVETTMRSSISVADGYADEVGLARLRPGLVAPATLVGPPTPLPARGPTPTQLKIRALRPDDAQAWSRTLSDEAVVWGTLQLPYQRAEQWESRIRDDDTGRVLVLGADISGLIVAGVALVISPALRRRHVASVGMHVSASLQGRGIGRRLMDEVLALADRIGVERVQLEVFGDNERAMRLYRSAGFVYEGDQRLTCYREGALVGDKLMSRLRSDPAS